MKWIDINDIALALEEQHPEVDVLGIRFKDLRQWVIDLPGFTDAPERCNEKVLEAVQMTWLEERK